MDTEENTHTHTNAPHASTDAHAKVAHTPLPDPDFSYVEGGVCAAKGFSASGLHLGFRKNPERLDAALVVADDGPAAAAGVFTTNVFAAAPVAVSREVAARGAARAIVLNSGNANAATGRPGMDVARQSAACVADALGCEDAEVFVASTGVIGVPLPLAPFTEGVPLLAQAAAPTAHAAHDAACAIMTTDTHPKECAVSFALEGTTCTVGGMCKGSGMIQPNMATMLAVLTTDAPVSAEAAAVALKQAVDASFNKITVDSDTSTNDSVFLLASGAASVAPIEAPAHDGGVNGASAAPADADAAPADAFATFARALRFVCEDLARQIAADGEGATKLVTVTVRGAENDADAELAARAIANSPLVKTAIAGRDCNWGRIAAAAGKSGAAFAQENCDIDIMGMPVCRAGLAQPFSEDEAAARFERDEIAIDVNLHAGGGHARVWTCDLTHEYIHINADYRS